jgi:glycosyltransferase involved in cell wall biosynthesis
MQQDFFVSVIIPVFNSQKYIGRCLRSLKNQSLNKKNYEIIVVNDFSKDNSLNEILKQKTNIIKVINNEKNLGLPASLNIGLKLAKGSFIVRVDSDDWVHVDFLNILSTFLYINKSLDAVACDYSLVDENENVIKEVNCDNKPVGCGIMFRMQHLLEINLYDEKFLYCEEEALRNEFQKKHKITRVPVCLYRYRQHEDNRSNNKTKVNRYSKKINR